MEFTFAGFRLVRVRQPRPEWQLIVGARGILLACALSGLIGLGAATALETAEAAVTTVTAAVHAPAH